MKNNNFHDDELMDYIADLEDALREIIEELPEFHDLMDLIHRRRGNVSLFMGLQVTDNQQSKTCARKTKKRKKGLIKNVPLKFEFTPQDKKFLKQLRIDSDT